MSAQSSAAQPKIVSKIGSRAASAARNPLVDRDPPPVAEAQSAPPRGGEAGAPSGAARPSRRQRARLILFALLPVFLIAALYTYATGGRYVSTDNAYIRADILPVSTDVSGIVKAVSVRDNAPVAKGDVLFTLDDTPFRIALDKANAELGIVTAQLHALKASYRDMQAQVRQAEADVAYDQKVLTRQQALATRNVSSQAAFDQATRDLAVAQEKVVSLKEQLAGIAAQLGGDPAIAVTDHPRYKAALAARDEAARQLAHTVVRAPMDGVTANVSSLQPGQYLPAATPAFSLVASGHVWVEAEPKETQLTHVKPGQKVTITVDTYPGVTWHGSVSGISPASAASFAVLPAQNTSGNWVKVVQRIGVRIRIDTQPDQPMLRAGMSAVIEIDTGHERGLGSIFSSASPEPRHG